MFRRINIVPRWLIFCLDLLCCALSMGLAYFIKYDFSINHIDIQELSRNLLIFGLINCIVFFNVKTYAGIVRYTSAQDSFRILFAISLSNGLFILANIVSLSLGKDVFISNVVIVITGLCSFVMLITYRVLVKYFFVYIKNLRLDKKRVVIFGAGETGIATKRALDTDPKINMSVVAFVDNDPRKSSKVVDNVKIYHADYLERILLEEKIDSLIFTAPGMKTEEKNKVVDLCLDNNVKVLNVPLVRTWVKGTVKTTQIKDVKIEDLLERDPIIIGESILNEQLSGKRILVTGAAGSIGSEIVRQLAKFNPQTIILNDIAETPLHELQLELQDNNLLNNFIAFIGDVRNKSRMEHLFETFKPHYVYHAAAYKHVPMMEHNPSEAICTNVGGTKNMADLAVKHGAIKFVMVSTDKAVNPTNVMGASKRIAEIYVQSLFCSSANGEKTRFITTRFGNVLGSNGSVIPRFREQIQKGGPLTVTHPDITRYFMTIPEACRLVLEAGSMGKGGEIYIFDMGQSVKIVELAKKMIRLSGFIPNQDIKIEFTGLRPGEKLYEELLNDKENTMPTHHEKIMIAKVIPYEFESVSIHIEDLVTLACNYQDKEVVRLMKKIVPEFKSNNSTYEELDKELEFADA
ncbi:polysaccharide biosynthesis protein CapD [Pseudopedobacter saltans DSM 12145]|uniref:Polysaccharide biosynthesis protein CapD n=1 Tax=Pseudopedobacter saltans (strain ATCC 51119 / DSM 12145 / JCM 21818 / CCUG 39354 / LMG 10337 / NBRC 100064 / NCIMB 13643) TaxID=762903 RepID=F0SBU7_PSESL|nr:nucleoside-diphosphate sugar epimerase/dehydratase [Pseudopedobacter saltans]ADY53788.1 polysaccharide biosynthesis protein CapD [Pseudopedobacter saltans DSM 12145]